MSRGLKISARYHRGNDVTLTSGDCLKFLRQLPDGSARLVITSPPYNLGKEYEHKLTMERYLAHQRAVIAECVRITCDGGSICWQVGNHTNGNGEVIPLDILVHPIFHQHAATNGVRLRNRLIWHFEHGLHCRKRFSGRYETVLWYTKGADYVFNLDPVRVPQKYPGKRAYQGPNKGQFSGNPLGKNPGDVWIFPNVKGNHIEKTNHPCQFPVELAARLILALTRPDELVVDPFMGVGSTAVAAVVAGRRTAGVDIVSAYTRLARQRVKQAALGRLPYRSVGKPVYVPAPDTPLTTPPDHFKFLPAEVQESERDDYPSEITSA